MAMQFLTLVKRIVFEIHFRSGPPWGTPHL
jgi:hypothetical protein